MKTETNVFGTGTLYEASDLISGIHATCSACMSIYSEFSSWANANKNRFCVAPGDINSVVILSCQVTDLAVLSDLRVLEREMEDWPGRDYYIGGCLARRFDIELPRGVRRLDNLYSDYTRLNDFWMVDYESPFWVPGFSGTDELLANGNLFREMYPLRIGVGCTGNCKYCTIRHTRGTPRKLEPNYSEFLSNVGDIVLIADSPSYGQLAEWFNIAEENNKPISIRNVEPHVAVKLTPKLFSLAQKGLLKIFHCPVQHTDTNALMDMRRNPIDKILVCQLAIELRRLGVICATNIIIDYKDFPNPNDDALRYCFDYISWNPYWDGVWDRENAEIRFKKYIKDGKN